MLLSYPPQSAKFLTGTISILESRHRYPHLAGTWHYASRVNSPRTQAFAAARQVWAD